MRMQYLCGVVTLFVEQTAVTLAKGVTVSMVANVRFTVTRGITPS